MVTEKCPMVERNKKNWFQLCYFTLIGIGVAVIVYLGMPEILKRLSPCIKSEWLLALMFLVGGFAIVGFGIHCVNRYYQRAGIKPTRRQVTHIMANPTIPLWIKLLQTTGISAILLAVGGLIMVFLGVPIKPGVHRIWDLGICPWIFLLGGLVVMVLLNRIQKKSRRATTSNYEGPQNRDEFPEWMMALGLMSLAAIARGIWVIAAAFFD